MLLLLLLLLFCRSKCDGFMVGSTKTDAALDTVEIPYEGEEECKLSFTGDRITKQTRRLLFPVSDTDTCHFANSRQHLATGSIHVELHLRHLLRQI
jgi:hypothetical protein